MTTPTELLSRRAFMQRLGLAGFAGLALPLSVWAQSTRPADMVIRNARIATLGAQAFVQTLAMRDGLVAAIGTDTDIARHIGPDTLVIDAEGRTVIPGLNDSHTHVIRGGLNYNMELRWDGVPSLSEALGRLKRQAQRTPPPQWVRVVGGWNEYQFAEKRLPTLDEINAATGDVPCMVVLLYAAAMVNRAGLRVLGIDRNTPNPPGGLIKKDRYGNPTGLFIAEPNAYIVYSTIARAPRLGFEDEMNSTRQFMRELNRLGVTSVVDAGGGGQNFPDDYKVIRELHRRGELTLRFAYNLFAQKPGAELADYQRWSAMTRPGEGDAFLRMNGAGENLVWSAADFENFLLPRPDVGTAMESELEQVVRHLAASSWPFRIHATYDETIGRFLNVLERVHRDVPIDKLSWFLDHAETISGRNMDRVAALGGGIAVQHRMAYQGEYFIERYGRTAASNTPPIRDMLRRGLPVGAGTDATRVSSYNPWVTLYWMVSGKTVGGTELSSPDNRLDRVTALRLMTQGSAWFSRGQAVKGTLAVGKFADFTMLDRDYFAVQEEDIKSISALLTVINGKPVYGAGSYAKYAPDIPPPSPDWSPVKEFGGWWQAGHDHHSHATHEHAETSHDHAHLHTILSDRGAWNLDCPCFG